MARLYTGDMRISIKLGKSAELESLKSYKGPFRYFELPHLLLREKRSIKDLIDRGFVFNTHGISMNGPKELEMLLEGSRRCINSCASLGIDTLILHGMIVKDQYLYIREDDLVDITFNALASIRDMAQKKGVNCLLENGYIISSKFREVPSDPVCHINLASRLYMGMVLDLGHAAISAFWRKTDFSDFILPYLENAKKPEIIHLSDNSLTADEHFAVGDGKANIRAYQFLIKELGKVLLTIENFPNSIYKSLMWLNVNFPNKINTEDIENFCRIMKWGLPAGAYERS